MDSISSHSFCWNHTEAILKSHFKPNFCTNCYYWYRPNRKIMQCIRYYIGSNCYWKVLRNCSDTGVLMAHPLLRQMKITGASVTAAKFKPAWKSPWKLYIVYLILNFHNLGWEWEQEIREKMTWIARSPHCCHHPLQK